MVVNDISNVVVVRFSLILNETWLKQIYGDPCNRESWLKYRLHIFNKTLRPSIIRQDTKPLAVYLLFDSSDQSFYSKYCSSLEDVFIPIFSIAGDHFEQVEKMIRDISPVNVAISRVDSDDCLARNYFSSVNRVIAKRESSQTLLRVVACSGYRSDGVRVQEVFSEVSPFLTLFVKAYKGENIYSINHSKLGELAYVKDRSARWIQWIHESNISNRFINTRNSKRDFEYKIVFNPESSIVLGTRPRWLEPSSYPDFFIPVDRSSWSLFHRIYIAARRLIARAIAEGGS